MMSDFDSVFRFLFPTITMLTLRIEIFTYFLNSTTQKITKSFLQCTCVTLHFLNPLNSYFSPYPPFLRSRSSILSSKFFDRTSLTPFPHPVYTTHPCISNFDPCVLPKSDLTNSFSILENPNFAMSILF